MSLTTSNLNEMRKKKHGRSVGAPLRINFLFCNRDQIQAVPSIKKKSQFVCILFFPQFFFLDMGSSLILFFIALNVCFIEYFQRHQ